MGERRCGTCAYWEKDPADWADGHYYGVCECPLVKGRPHNYTTKTACEHHLEMSENPPFTRGDLRRAIGRCERYNEDESREDMAFQMFAEYASEDFPRALAELERAWDLAADLREKLGRINRIATRGIDDRFLEDHTRAHLENIHRECTKPVRRAGQ